MSMEIKIPKDIKQFQESVFFGLSIRQMVCSGVAVAAAVGAYYGLRNYVGTETISWVCVLCAAPFAIAAFFTFNGMTLEQFAVAWFRSEFLCAGPRRFTTDNTYRMVLHDVEHPPRREKRAQKKSAKQKPKKGAKRQ